MFRVLTAVVAIGLCGVFAGEVRADVKATNLKKDDWQNFLDTYIPMGYRITHFDVKVINGEPRYDLELAKRGGPPWVMRSGLTSAQFEDLSKELARKGT